MTYPSNGSLEDKLSYCDVNLFADNNCSGFVLNNENNTRVVNLMKKKCEDRPTSQPCADFINERTKRFSDFDKIVTDYCNKYPSDPSCGCANAPDSFGPPQCAIKTCRDLTEDGEKPIRLSNMHGECSFTECTQIVNAPVVIGKGNQTHVKQVQVCGNYYKDIPPVTEPSSNNQKIILITILILFITSIVMLVYKVNNRKLVKLAARAQK